MTRSFYGDFPLNKSVSFWLQELMFVLSLVAFWELSVVPALFSPVLYGPKPRPSHQARQVPCPATPSPSLSGLKPPFFHEKCSVHEFRPQWSWVDLYFSLQRTFLTFFPRQWKQICGRKKDRRNLKSAFLVFIFYISISFF